MQVNIQGVEHGLQRIAQIYSRLYNNEDTLGETKLDTEMEKKKVEGYPHLPVSFYRRLQFSEHKLSQEKHGFGM